ncbi:ABC transporter ATP-binding protein [Streptomyces mutabilis]|uniref:ABC transporter ATP-binding protein n=1 Tax=Streptomyces mutabilis TaxID=67332 RepID=A0A086N7C5_9ACTN|nr:ABC transporter ATP-binding protein [Streptomyces mutabilis]KFG77043.1 ABC transporter ATP-binding protein [Streptomyces mutabilis]
MGKSSVPIEISGLTKSFGDVKAVDGLSFSVQPGSVTGFLGPNGAGKSTTLRMLLGLVRPDAGVATIGGRRYGELASPSDEIGAALDASGFHPRRSGRGHLRVLCTANGIPSKRADEVLEKVGLADAAQRKVKGYSLGMRQRLALAGALLGNPSVLVLDEPANGLDPKGINWMRSMLRESADQGGTVLVSSHVLSEVEQLVDRVVVINKGRLVREGTLDEVAGGEGSVVTVRTPQADALLALFGERMAGGVRADRAEADLVRVWGLDVAEVGRIASAAGLEIHELGSERSSLEDIFFALTGDQ